MGGWDFWIVKTDSLGNKLWDKDLGGTFNDECTSICQTADGGFIIGGTSYSDVSGDKTQPVWGASDYWIVKIDSLGNKQWDKDFGGTDYEYLFSIHQTSDGGYILRGESQSGISGDKTQSLRGATDYWIVKIDSLGNKQWDKDFGGTSYETLFSIQQTFDGGYILGGFSHSGISGDKTQPNWDGSGYTSDYWIIKTDSLGNKQWDKDFGGTDDDDLISIEQTTDSGYILGGTSESGISGNKIEPSWGVRDFWIIKTDSLGNKQWDKDFGGTNHEEFFSISKTTDYGYLFSGDSYSSISGNKTQNNLGSEQTWIVKTDSLGNITWDKTIFTDGHDEWGLTIQTYEGCYVTANFSTGGIAGDKSENAWNGSNDYWIVKFCDSAFIQANLTTTTNLCPGTCTDFLNLSFNATSYQWYFPGAIPDTSTDINPLNICYAIPGNYGVQLIATNANGSDTLILSNYITVVIQPPPQSISQIGDTLIALAGATYYQWYFNGNIINGATNYFYIAQASGDYNLVATDSNGCEVEAVINNVIANLPSNSLSEDLISISPIPGSEKLFLNSSVNIVSLKILDLIGNELLTEKVIQKKVELDIRFLSKGIYFLQVQTEKGNVVKKFIKE